MAERGHEPGADGRCDAGRPGDDPRASEGLQPVCVQSPPRPHSHGDHGDAETGHLQGAVADSLRPGRRHTKARAHRVAPGRAQGGRPITGHQLDRRRQIGNARPASVAGAEMIGDPTGLERR